MLKIVKRYNISAGKVIKSLMINKYPYVVIFTVALISLTWFKDQSLLTSFLADYLPILKQFDITRYFYVWYDGSLGYGFYTIPSILFPTSFISLVFGAMGLESHSIQSIYLYFMFAMMGFSMCFLLSSIYFGRHKNIVMLTGSGMILFQ